jgi:hypothetical protein
MMLRARSSELTAAAQRVQERRATLRRRGTALASRARRAVASPVALLAAAGAGWVLGSPGGRRALLKAYSMARLALAAMSALRA